MSMAGLSVFDTTIQKTNLWLHELMEDLGWDSRQKAYHALRCVLHELRDHLPVNEAVHLGSQLPMLVRGFYYEGWRPAGKPVKDHSAEQFLITISEEFPKDANNDAEKVIHAVFCLLSDHIPGGEIDKVISVLPKPLRRFWLEFRPLET